MKVNSKKIRRFLYEASTKKPGDHNSPGFSIYANNEPKSALARDLGDCRDNKGKTANRVFTC